MESITKEGKITELCAVVTGANKGIGLAVARQLAQRGITVVLTARDKDRAANAVESLQRDLGPSSVVFHQLDVRDPLSVADLAQFIGDRFGKLDILVNNAGTLGVSVDEEGLKALNISSETWISGKAAGLIQGVVEQTYDDAVRCLDTNYHGCRRVTEALLPLLQLSTAGARIVNISSDRSRLERIPDDAVRCGLGDDAGSLDEERIENVLVGFLGEFDEGKLKSRGWTTTVPAYNVSKVAVNAYTRVLAKRYPEMYINCVHPGNVKTDINWNSGVMTPDEGAEGVVVLAVVPDGGPSGCYFDQTKMAEF